MVKYYRCEKKCGVFCHLFFDHNGCFVNAQKSCSQHTPPSTAETPYYEMKRELHQILDSSSDGWCATSTKLYMDMMRRLRRKNEGFKLKSRKSSVMRFIRVVKRRHFKSYDVMADEMLRSIFVPFDPQKAGSFLDEDIIIMCNKER